MEDQWLEERCLAYAGTSKDYQPFWRATRFFAGGKMFAILGWDKEGRRVFTIKLPPDFGDFLRHCYPSDIIPGYHFNKTHWNSLYPDGNVPTEIVCDMVASSYQTVVRLLPKTKQRLLAETADDLRGKGALSQSASK